MVKIGGDDANRELTTYTINKDIMFAYYKANKESFYFQMERGGVNA